MVRGSNTNIRHRGRIFHVQTEDSGLANPHVITHLYFEGTILASSRREYGDAVGRPGLAAHVRALIEAQHDEMLAAVRRGEHDALIEQRLGPLPEPPAAPAAPQAASGEKSLDDTILDYLIQKARERSRGDAARRSRGEG